MHLEGSCHCGAVSFAVEAAAPEPEPEPFMKCYCEFCRKAAGGGGYSINLGADYRTLKVKGREHVRTYRVRLDRTEYGKDEPNAARKKSKVDRRFCGRCGSALWVYSPLYPELVHPFVGAIDTPLPKAPEANHILLDYSWSGSRCRAGLASTTSSAIPANRSTPGTNSTASTSHHAMRRPPWPPI